MRKKSFNGVKLSDWFEWLALSMLNVDFYYSHDDKEVAKELLKKLENHPARNWGWGWRSILGIYYDGIEAWDELEVEKKDELVELLFEYIEKLAKA